MSQISEKDFTRARIRVVVLRASRVPAAFSLPWQTILIHSKAGTYVRDTPVVTNEATVTLQSRFNLLDSMAVSPSWSALAVRLGW